MLQRSGPDRKQEGRTLAQAWSPTAGLASGMPQGTPAPQQWSLSDKGARHYRSPHSAKQREGKASVQIRTQMYMLILVMLDTRVKNKIWFEDVVD